MAAHSTDQLILPIPRVLSFPQSASSRILAASEPAVPFALSSPRRTGVVFSLNKAGRNAMSVLCGSGCGGSLFGCVDWESARRGGGSGEDMVVMGGGGWVRAGFVLFCDALDQLWRGCCCWRRSRRGTQVSRAVLICRSFGSIGASMEAG